MKVRIPISLAIISAVIVLFVSSASTLEGGRESSSIVVNITIDGLADQKGMIRLLPDTANGSAPTLLEQEVSNGSYNLSLPIANGIFKLVLEGPVDYFHEPKGYLFTVYEGKLINTSNRSLIFTLLPPSVQSLPPCRDAFPVVSQLTERQSSSLEEEKVVCMAESLISISDPIKEPEPQDEGFLTTGYHYIGPKTTQDNQGVWGRNYVVNASICHNCSPTQQFVAERVYADNGSNWMEAGWTEVSWRSDAQYLYTMDSADPCCRHWYDNYPLSWGSTVETRVRYTSSVSKWRALYFLGNGTWAVLREVNIGFVTASNGYNRGEIYTSNGVHPSYPNSTFDKGYLYISGVWDLWDTTYTSSTTIANDAPYDTHMIYQYYSFYVHYH